jgi:hypothetical protein
MLKMVIRSLSKQLEQTNEQDAHSVEAMQVENSSR